MTSLTHHEWQTTDVGMNQWPVDKGPERELHDVAHLFSPGREDGRVVMGDNPELANTAERILRDLRDKINKSLSN